MWLAPRSGLSASRRTTLVPILHRDRWAHVGSGGIWRKQNLVPPPGLNSESVQSQTSFGADYTIRSPFFYFYDNRNICISAPIIHLRDDG